jgi:hypothetical protein
MSWDVTELRHNASILYNKLCSETDAPRVYVDKNGHLQLDNSGTCQRGILPFCDVSRSATDKAAIRTLRRVLTALEDGTLKPKEVISWVRIDIIGLWLRRDVGEEDDPDEPIGTLTWIDKEDFATRISKADRFKAGFIDGNQPDHELVCRKVAVLTRQILDC